MLYEIIRSYNPLASADCLLDKVLVVEGVNDVQAIPYRTRREAVFVVSGLSCHLSKPSVEAAAA
jgi:hypothetical protein